jgi:hypothetical protein
LRLAKDCGTDQSKGDRCGVNGKTRCRHEAP